MNYWHFSLSNLQYEMYKENVPVGEICIDSNEVNVIE